MFLLLSITGCMTFVYLFLKLGMPAEPLSNTILTAYSVLWKAFVHHSCVRNFSCSGCIFIRRKLEDRKEEIKGKGKHFYYSILLQSEINLYISCDITD